MTVTLSLGTKSNRFETHRQWDLSGTTVTVGTLQTALFKWWLFRAGVLIDSSFAGPVFGHVFDLTNDSGVEFTLVYQVLEESAGSDTEGSVTWTHSPTAIDHTKYVDTAGTDDTAAGRGDSSGDPYATLGYAMTRIKLLMDSGESVRVLAKAGQTHSVSASLWNYEETGRIIVDRYGAGADPIIDLTSDVVLFNGMGQHSSTGNCALDFRNCEVTGGTGYTSQVVLLNAYGGATSPLDRSHVLYNIACTNTGTLVQSSEFPTLSESEVTSGYRDCLAVVGCSSTAPGSGAYGIYVGSGIRYFLLDGLTVTTVGGAQSAIRAYNLQFLWGRDVVCSDMSGDSFRILSTTQTADIQSRWQVFESWVSYDAPYLFHNSDAEGGDSTENKFWDQWFHGCRSNPSLSGGMAFSLGGDRRRISIRGTWLRDSLVSMERNNADNDSAVDFYMECNTEYDPSFGGGDAIMLNAGAMSAADTISGWHVRNNFYYCPSGSGTADFGIFSTASGDITRSTIFASNSDTNYNVFLVPTGTVRWYRSVAGGNAVLSTWDDTGCDANSQVLTSGTHGLTALGTSGADDYDFNISTSSSARNAGVAVPGGQIDYDGMLRVATHDAGANDADASTEPDAPNIGGYSLTCNTSSYIVLGNIAVLKYNRRLYDQITNQSARYSILGKNNTFRVTRTLLGSKVSITINGKANTFKAGRRLSCDKRHITVTYKNNILKKAFRLYCDKRVYTVNRISANLLKQHKLPCTKASYLVNGRSNNFIYNRKLISSNGTYVVSGYSANLLKLGGSGILGESVVYTLSGKSATLNYSRRATLTGTSYSVLGKTSSLLRQYSSGVLSPRSYSINVNQATLNKRFFMSNTGVSLSVSYKNNRLLRTYLIGPGSNTYTVNGKAASLAYTPNPDNVVLIGNTGSYNVSGGTCFLLYTRRLDATKSSISINFDSCDLVKNSQIHCSGDDIIISGGTAGMFKRTPRTAKKGRFRLFY